MRFSIADLKEASKESGLSEESTQQLFRSIEKRSRFTLSRILSYFAAFAFFSGLLWLTGTLEARAQILQATALTSVSAALMYIIGAFFWKKRPQLADIGALFLLFAIFMFSRAVLEYGQLMQIWKGSAPFDVLGSFMWLKDGLWAVDLLVLAVSIVSLYFFRAALLVTPILVTSLFLFWRACSTLCSCKTTCRSLYSCLFNWYVGRSYVRQAKSCC